MRDFAMAEQFDQALGAMADWSALGADPATLEAMTLLQAGLPAKVGAATLGACCLLADRNKRSPEREAVVQLLSHLGASMLVMAKSVAIHRKFGLLDAGTFCPLLKQDDHRGYLDGVFATLVPASTWPKGTAPGWNLAPRMETLKRLVGALALHMPFHDLEAFLAPAWEGLGERRDLQDAKTILQECAHAARWPPPVYLLLGQEGPDHQPCFRVSVTAGAGQQEATGSTIKRAQMEAATLLLERFRSSGHCPREHRNARLEAKTLMPHGDLKAAREVEARLGYTFRNPQLLHTALAHRMLSSGRAHLGDLGFLADNPLQTLFTLHLFEIRESNPDALADIHSCIMGAFRNDILARDESATWLRQRVRFGPRGPVKGAGSAALAAEVMKAVLAAVWLDSGCSLTALRQVTRVLLANAYQRLETFTIRARATNDPKTVLQEVCALAGLAVAYGDFQSSGPEHAPQFTATLLFDPKGAGLLIHGASNTVTGAEKAAASLLLQAVSGEATVAPPKPGAALEAGRRLLDALHANAATLPLIWTKLSRMDMFGARDLLHGSPKARIACLQRKLDTIHAYGASPEHLLAALEAVGKDSGGEVRRLLAQWGKTQHLVEDRWDEAGVKTPLREDRVFLALQGINALLGKLAHDQQRIVRATELADDLSLLRLRHLDLRIDPAPEAFQWLECKGVVLELLAFVLEGLQRAQAPLCHLTWEPEADGAAALVLRAPELQAAAEAAMWSRGLHAALLKASLWGGQAQCGDGFWRLSMSALPDDLRMPQAMPIAIARSAIRSVLRQYVIDPEQALLAAVTLHDFKNILLAMDACLAEARRNPDSKYAHLAEGERCQKQARALWEQFRQAMGGTGDYHFEAVDFQGIMRNFLTRVAKILPSTVTFRSDQAAGSCLVVCDNNLLESVLENLVINAVNAMPGGGRIEIRWGLSEDGGQVFVEICDSGPGLPDAVLAALEGGTPPASSGRPGRIGLGLVNARRIIVRLHGGQLKLERLAEGSRVAIVLPLAPWSAEVA